MKKIVILISMLAATSVFAEAPTYTIKHYKETHSKGLINKKMPPSVKWESYTNANVNVPGSVDLSASMSLPENQGTCGDCWNFALTKSLRSEYMIQGRDPGVLEFNYLLNNCGPGPAMLGCNGGTFSAAYSFYNAGPGLEALNPYYPAVTGYCSRQPAVASAQAFAMLGLHGTNPSFKDLAVAIGVNHHMVAVDVAAASGNWEQYADGIYNGCTGGPANLDHMIDAVGYNCETSVDASGHCVFDAQGKPVNHDGYLIVENNWGEVWGTTAANGHRGYMKTRMYGADGSHCNAIASNALIFRAR